MKTADIHSQLQALISSCIDEGDYDPAEDYIKDPFCRRTMHTASLAINEIDTLRARVEELEAECDRLQSLANVYRTEVMARRNERAAFFSKTMKYEEWQAASRQVEIARADTDAARAANGGEA